MFMKHVRGVVEEEPKFANYLPEWSRFLVCYARRKTLDRDASKMSNQVTLRRYFRRLCAYVVFFLTGGYAVPQSTPSMWRPQ